jgi:HrpA-like RNA helicase
MAESSITIDGVVVVIDTGLAEQEVFDKARNMSIMRVGTISQASAKQRRGRASRIPVATAWRAVSFAKHIDPCRRESFRCCRRTSPEV